MSEFFLEDFQEEMRDPEVMKFWDALVDVFIMSTGIDADVKILQDRTEIDWFMNRVEDALWPK